MNLTVHLFNVRQIVLNVLLVIVLVLIDDVMVNLKICKNSKFKSFYFSSGIRHCLDFSDETGCPPRYPNNTYCLSDKYTCNNTVCIPHDYKCDGGELKS